jgi:hypothetical protein
MLTIGRQRRRQLVANAAVQAGCVGCVAVKNFAADDDG